MITRKKIISRLVLTGLLATLTIPCAHAQNNSERSPYSRYGYGRLGERMTAGARAMGGLGAGLRDPNIVSPANPASYTAVDSLTFIMDLAVSLRGSYLSEGSKKDSRVLGNLDYATILFPVSKHLAVSAGIMPFSTVGYRFGNTEKLQGDNSGSLYQRAYSGEGSYNDLYLGVGGRIGNFSLGVNASYLFGYTTRQHQVIYSSGSNAINPVDRSQLHLKGFRFDFGAQYEWMLDAKRGKSLVFGATFAPEMGLRSESVLLQYQYNTQTGRSTLLRADTLSSGAQHISPMSLSGGLTYRYKDVFTVGADISYMKWGSAGDNAGTGARFTDRYRIAVGGEWLPNYRGRSIFSRSYYRFGLNGSNSYVKVPTPDATLAGYTQYGASLGIGIPLVDRRSLVSLTIDYSYLHPQASGMVKEHSLGLTVGVTFNEGWFRKARIN